MKLRVSLHIHTHARCFMKCLLPSLHPFTALPALLNLEVNSLKRSLAELLFKKPAPKMPLLPLQFLLENILVLSCLWTLDLCSLFVIVGLLWTQVVFFQHCWGAAGFALLFVYCRIVVWKEVGKIGFLPRSPFLCVHSQASQLGISRAQQELSHLCSALVVPVLYLFFYRTASLLAFLSVSWGFALVIWIGRHPLPRHRALILDWATS